MFNYERLNTTTIDEKYISGALAPCSTLRGLDYCNIVFHNISVYSALLL